MTRFMMPVLCAFACALVCVPASAEDPPKKLTAEERKELEAKVKKFNAVGAEASRQGEFPAATKAFEEALKVARQLYPKAEFPDGHPLLLDGLTELASAYWKQQNPSADSLLKDARDMATRLLKANNPDVIARLDALGALYRARGDLAEDESLHRDALAMLKRIHPGDHPATATALGRLAEVFRRRGKEEEAEQALRDAVAMQRRLFKDDREETAINLNNLGHLLTARGKAADAEPVLRDALAMKRRLYKGDHVEVSSGLINLGDALYEQGKWPGAEAAYREAIEIDKRLKIGNNFRVAELHSNLGWALWHQGKLAAAEPVWRVALDNWELAFSLFGRDHPALISEYCALARLLHARGKFDEAERLFLEATDMRRRLLGNVDTARGAGMALSILSMLPLSRDGFLSVARDRNSKPASVYPEVWIDKGAASRVYEDRLLRAHGATDRADVDLLSDLAQARRRRADLLLSPVPNVPADRQQREESLRAIDAELVRLNESLGNRLPPVVRAARRNAAGEADLRKELGPATALIDFVRYKHTEHDPKKPGAVGVKLVDRYLGFVVTVGAIAWADLGPAAPIDEVVGAWRDAITGGKEIPVTMPAKLRELVWVKVRKELPAGIRTVYICPDADLCRVPWALPGDKPGTILLEDFALATIPHAPFLLDKFWPQDPIKNPPTGVLVVGGVKYDAEPAAVGAVASRGAPLVKPDAKLTWTALAATVGEANGVAEAAVRKKLTATRLDGEKATPAAVLSALPKAKVAHFATHGFFADPSFRGVFQLDEKDYEKREGRRIGRAANSPLVMTGLVFAGANNPKTPGRGIITGEALVDLDLSGLELAVLSAYETGIGDVAGGEGTFGLQRAFHSAGTTNVVASLWKVPDQSTAALMALFYRNLWEQNLTPMEALRQAQLELYRNPAKIPELAKGFRGKFEEVAGANDTEVKPGKDGKAHPLLWAAFTLSGPGR